MASVVEYKGLKAGYHCGYCDSEEGKASHGEGPRRGRLASSLRTARRAPGRPCAGEPAGSAPPLPLSFPTRFFLARCLSPRSLPPRRRRSCSQKERK